MSSLVNLARIILILSVVALLPTCTTTGSTSSHVDAQLRKHGI
ncbi:hypothetical protein [Methylorubrum thiocyanatum]